MHINSSINSQKLAGFHEFTMYQVSRNLLKRFRQNTLTQGHKTSLLVGHKPGQGGNTACLNIQLLIGHIDNLRERKKRVGERASNLPVKTCSLTPRIVGARRP